MFTIIFILVFTVIIYFIFSSIKLRLKFDDAIKCLDLSYTFIRFRLLFNDMTGRIYFAKIRIKKFGIKEALFAMKDKKARRDEEIKKEDIAKKKKRKPVWARSLNFKQILFYLKKLSYPIRKIKIKYLNIEISDGFSDPYYTGQMYAIYSTVTGIFPKLMLHINFKPDFSADSIKIRGEGLVKLRLYHILLPLLQILADKIFGMVRTPFLRLKKGTSYV